MDACRLIFPTLDFGRVAFWLADDSDSDRQFPAYADGVTINRLGGTDVVIRRRLFGPCAPRFFTVLLHELVHVLQRQSRGLFMDRVSSITCSVLHAKGRDDPENCVEAEAYAFETAWQLALAPNEYPCTCTAPPGGARGAGTGAAFGVSNPAFAAKLATLPPNLIKREAGCPPERCVGGNALEVALGAVVLISAYITTPFLTFADEGEASRSLSVIAGAGGMLVGGWLGAAVGVGLLGALVGAMFGLIIGALVGTFVGGLVGAIIHWLFGGGVEGGSLNVMFSTDAGLTFSNKATFERSREQPALAFANNPDRLFVGWTGIGGALNVVTAAVGVAATKATLEQGTPSGPALAWSDAAMGRKLFLGWRGGGDHPNVSWSGDGVTFLGKFTTQGSAPLQSNIGLAVGRGTVYLAWVGANDNRIRIIHLRPADPIAEVFAQRTLLQQTGHMQTPALAWGGGELWVVWSEFAPPHKIRLLPVPVADDGRILDFDDNYEMANTRVLADFTKDTTGPALAIDEARNRIYVAFTGDDDGVWVVRSDDRGATWPGRCRLPNELSRSDAGPAVAVHSDGTAAVCWVGTDGS